MMRAVWSFWSLPYTRHYHAAWPAERYHLMSWVLSLHTVRKHFPATVLCTDIDGARLLVDELQLEFDTVDTSLDRLREADTQWWVLGKLHAYRAQRDPFIHFDSDVYLWRAFDQALLSADIVTQNPEPIDPNATYYHPHVLEAALTGCLDGWLPEQWRWYRQQPVQTGECCGVFGGNDLELISGYADSALRLLEHPGNQGAWHALAERHLHNVLPEQYLLSACIQHHRHAGHAVRVGHVFESLAAGFAPDAGRRSGFTHLIADAKHDPVLLQRLMARVQRECPDVLERVWRVGAAFGAQRGRAA